MQGSRPVPKAEPEPEPEPGSDQQEQVQVPERAALKPAPPLVRPPPGSGSGRVRLLSGGPARGPVEPEQEVAAPAKQALEVLLPRDGQPSPRSGRQESRSPEQPGQPTRDLDPLAQNANDRPRAEQVQPAPLRNAGGCEEKHSRYPELWNIDGTELDLKGKYKLGGQLWYLQDRALGAINTSRPIAGFPINQAAVKSGHAFTPPDNNQDGDGSDEAEENDTSPANNAPVDPYAIPGEANLYTMMMEAIAKQKDEHGGADDYLFARRSLYLFGRDSRFRLACQRYHCGLDARASVDKLNNVLVFFAVVSSCTAVVQAEYYHAVDKDEETVRLVSDSVQLGIHVLFALDALPRIVAMGFCMDPQAYLRRPKYFVEFTLLILLIPTELHLWGGGVPWSPSSVEGPASTQLLPEQVSWALPLRCLVFIRMTTHVKNLTLLCRTILEAIPQLSLMFIMMGLIMTATSIMGVQLWHGLFRHKCFPIDDSVYNGSVFDIRPAFIDFGERSSLCMPQAADGSAAAGRMCANYHAYCDSPTQPRDGVDAGNHGAGVDCERMFRMEQIWGPLECRADSSNLYPHEKLLSFDNFGQAMFLVFQIITLSSWSQIMYIVSDVDNGMVAVAFFVVVVVFGAYFIQNLTIAILKAKFDTATAKILEELRLEERIVVHELEFAGADRGKLLVTKMRQKVRALGALGVLQKFMDEKASQGLRVDAHPLSRVRWKQARAKVATVNVIFGGMEQARRQQLRAQAATAVAAAEYTLGRTTDGPAEGLQNLIFGKNFENERRQPEESLQRTSSFMARAWKIQMVCIRMTDDRKFEKVFIMLTMFNTLLLAAEFHGQPDWYSNTIEYSNMACTFAFACEMAIRLVAETPKGYIKNAFNVFDGFIVVTSMIDLMVLTSSATGVSSIRSLRIFRMFRVFRVLRVIKLIRYLTDLKNIIVIVIRCIPHVTWVCLLLLIALFTYSLAAMYMFRGLMDFPHGKPRANFDSFFLSVVSMFQVLTLDDWEFIMYDASQAAGNLRPCVFFTSWILLGVYILLNVITILILSRFLSHSDEDIMKNQAKVVAETLAQMVKRDIPTQKLPENEQADAKDRSSEHDVQLTPVVVATPSLPGSVDSPAETRTADPEIQTLRMAQASDNDATSIPEITSGVTRRCAAEIIEHKWFDRIVLSAIIMNTVILAMDHPGVEPESSEAKAFEIIDYILTAFFTIEMAIKVHGLTLRGYLQHGWNVVDAIIVVLSDIGIIIQIYVQVFQVDENDSNLALVRTIRVMRVLRPLLLVGHFQGMKLIIEAVVKSALSIVNVLLLLMFVWMIFAIVGMNLFSGKLYHCTDDEVQFRSECIGVFVPEVENPVTPRLAVAHPITRTANMPEEVSVREWVAHGSTFDNFFEALVTLNEMNSFQEWPDTAWMAVDSTEVDQQPHEGNGPYYILYFMAFIIISQYMFMNLFIGVIFTSFAQVKAIQSGKDIMTRRQLCWLHVSQMIANSSPIAVPPLPQGGWLIGRARRVLYRLVLSRQVDLLIQCCIVANVVVLAVTHHGMTKSMESNLSALNTAFNLIFMVEAAAKILAISWAQYWSRGWNRLDFILVALSAVDFIIISNVNTPKMEDSFDSRATVRAIGALRVLRVLRLVRKSRQVVQLFQMMKDSAGYFANALLVYLLLLIIFSILAMNLFGTVNRGSYLHDRANFETFWSSMLTLFRAASSDDWNELSYGASLQEPHCNEGDNNCGHFWFSRAFFFVFNGIMALVFMNLLAAVFLENFDEIEMKARYRVNTEDVRRFQHCWLYYDTAGAGHISIHDLPDLLREVGPPIGVPKRATNSEILRLLRSKKLKVPNGMKSSLVGDAPVLVRSDEVHYYDLLFSLCWRCCGVNMTGNKLVEETMNVLKSRGMCSVNRKVKAVDDDNSSQKIEVVGHSTPSPRIKLLKATARLGLGGIGRSGTHEKENDPLQHAKELQGWQELGRAYAGHVITRAARQKFLSGDHRSHDTAARRRRESVTDYLMTHA